MTSNARLYFIHARSPLHAGTGQGVGVVDLPIAREKATGIPYIPGSSIKGVLRDRCADHKRKAIFGPEGENASDHASSVLIGDAHLLLLPVRSLAGTFAWVTSPYLLRRVVAAADDVTDTSVPTVIPHPSWSDDQIECCVATGTAITLETGRKVYLEDLDLDTTTNAENQKAATEWATWIAKHLWAKGSNWQTELQGRFCIVPDDVFTFLLDTATEVIARIAMENDRKTVREGGLWYEEALPTESILMGLTLANPVKKANTSVQEIFTTLETLTQTTLQLGGKATVGRGLCRVHVKLPDGSK